MGLSALFQKKEIKSLLIVLFAATVLVMPSFFFPVLSASAGENGLRKGPTKWGLGLCGGKNWSPDTDDIRFITVQGSALFDHDPFFTNKSAKGLSWILEVQAGSTVDHPRDFLASVGMLIKPQVEPFAWLTLYGLAGIGGIYTEFQVQGQGLKFNFNPQLGLGADIAGKYYVQVRWHHISNGGLHEDNAGINSLVLHSGIYF